MIIDEKYLLFSLKLLFSKGTYLICQKSTLNMPKLLDAEFFSGYEILVRTLQQQHKCINSLNIVNCNEHKSQSFVNIFFKMHNNYQIIGSMYSFTNFPCRACMYYCTLSTSIIILINSLPKNYHFQIDSLLKH